MSSREPSNNQMPSAEMPTSDADGFEETSEIQQRNSVYDFLYQDVRRVGSFLAQFDQYGVRQAVKATESTGRTSVLKGAVSGSLGLPTIMGATTGVDTSTTDEVKDLAEHTFDPLWANSRRLLDYLAENELINRQILNAALGQFVLIEGSLSIIDTSLLDPVFADQEIFSAFVRQSLRDTNTPEGSPQAIEQEQTLRVLSRLPKVISLFIYANEAPLWALISPDSLVVQPHDLAFKHGAVVRGRWNVLGILDAWPDSRDEPSDTNPNPQTLDEIGADLLHDSLIKVAANFTNMSRNMIGRPRTHYGITPLLIFREVEVNKTFSE